MCVCVTAVYYDVFDLVMKRIIIIIKHIVCIKMMNISLYIEPCMDDKRKFHFRLANIGPLYFCYHYFSMLPCYC